MDDFGTDAEVESVRIFESAYSEPAPLLDFGLEDYTLVQSHYSVAECIQFETPAPLSIVKNTIFPAQAVAGKEATGLEPHDAYYFPWETLNNPVNRDEFAYDVNGPPLVLNHSHNETSIAAFPETDEIVNNVSKANPSNDMNSFSRSNRKTKSTAQVWTCVVCHKEVATYHDLKFHAWLEYHATIKCRVQPCNYVHIFNNRDYLNHLRTSHPNLYVCVQCNTPFRTQELLEGHNSESGHTSFICDHQDCGKMFPRLDTYKRHQKVHQKDAQRFPCKYCKKYRGTNGFKRKDHLTQHLWGYHHIGEDGALKLNKGYYSCTEKGCSEYRELRHKYETGHAFINRPDYVKHMKAVHDTSEFPCPEPGCERVGAKGYFRIADIRAHLRKVHNIADPVIEQGKLPAVYGSFDVDWL